MNSGFYWQNGGKNMLKYREFLDLTDEEIKFILTEIFNPVKIGSIERDKEWNEIAVEMTTGGWDDGEGGEFEIEDTITLKMPSIHSCGLEVDFSLTKEDKLKWKQFILAKGCDYLLKDNPYITQ